MPAQFVQLEDFPGYRVGSDRSVQTEWQFKGRGRGMPPVWYRSGDWRPLSIARDKRGRHSARLRQSEGVYRRILIPTLLHMAFPVTQVAI